MEVRRDGSVLVTDGQRIDPDRSTVSLDLHVPLADLLDTVDVHLDWRAFRSSRSEGARLLVFSARAMRAQSMTGASE